jgi:hypothetical protein
MNMKPVIFDRHAKRRMKERGVDESETVRAIETPDISEPSLRGRTNAYKFMSGRYLRITYKEEPDYIMVITVTIRTRPFKERNNEDRI